MHIDPTTDAGLLNEQVRMIVANAVPALSIDRVSITNFTASASSGANTVLQVSDQASATGSATAQAIRRPNRGTTLEWVLFSLAAGLAGLAGIYLLLGARLRGNS
ncbi:MAG: hypothetical protein HC779_00280 [Phyllobacteriaceae bacterium]|nr:hypothetical protein [Phyllobacteriaceae bacterium]